jgi:hypothetical protein
MEVELLVCGCGEVGEKETSFHPARRDLDNDPRMRIDRSVEDISPINPYCTSSKTRGKRQDPSICVDKPISWGISKGPFLVVCRV